MRLVPERIGRHEGQRHQEGRSAADQHRVSRHRRADRRRRLLDRHAMRRSPRPSCGARHRSSLWPVEARAAPASEGRSPGRGAGPAIGRLIVTVVPSSGALSIVIVPSWSVTSPLTSDRPRPVPSMLPRIVVLHLHERLADPREIVGGDADARIATPRNAGASRSARAPIATVPPSGVNLMALETRLISICCTARRSAWISPTSRRELDREGDPLGAGLEAQHRVAHVRPRRRSGTARR